MCVLKVKVISLPYIFQVLCFTRPRNQVSVYRTIGPLVRCGLKMGCEFSINISKSMPKSEQACLKLVKPGFSIFESEKIRITQVTCASHLLYQMLCPVSRGCVS